ncbi:BamA/TamA family outer membrane protein [Mucilaginibacter pallidiroseus]|uniref:BamA/TamA family outer membrane protein n=1 Tax=Mucilaginibacter pallidiroseus TaxID=2599295 RepID=A0A563UCU6_9SPHI|nr:BamA/TamA family outer membrane protein [Mucilaginibacter pallidiroseus]TWR29192.1 BamA/TamA family outer membrane protein [Mucilaginibacter pallidiroseus]
MIKKLHLLTILLPAAALSAHAQQSPKPLFKDSVTVKVHPKYDSVGSIHKFFFGTNYRKEWAAAVKLPVIRLSDVAGGLKIEKEGGGMQSKSLRLKDRTGKEWVLRTVEKTPDKLLPEALRETFAVDWLDDALSGQHPFSALVMPPLAKAARVPHTNPVIGVVAADKALGEYSKLFVNTVCLLEEREPEGDSDNTIKMLEKLKEDNDNTFDGEGFLRARMLDLLVGDWDRHEDQWRWADKQKGSGKMYVAVPRDRDQVFHLEEGLFPDIAAMPWLNPLLGDFTPDLPHAKYNLYKTRFGNPYPAAQMTHEQYMAIVNDFVRAETDEVLEAGLRRLPPPTYKMGHDVLLAKLKARRDNLPAAMDKYYKLIYSVPDIRLSDKNEKVTITGMPDSSLYVLVNKINKEGEVKDTLMATTYSPKYTEEIRLYTSAGDDQVIINNTTSTIKLRVVGAEGNKVYNVVQSQNKVRVYAQPSAKFEGPQGSFKKHLDADTMNTRFVQTNPYNFWMPLATAAINADDGVLLGVGAKYTKRDGFRKLPYTSTQQLLVLHAFATDAFRIRYNGEWIQALGKADITMQAYIQAPDNTMNFFGVGNGTVLNKAIPAYRRYYRTRFNTVELDPALRWRLGKSTTISAGPSFQYYHLNVEDNAGRFIFNSSQIGSYDSLTVDKDRYHLGASINLITNKRKGGVLPVGGYFINIWAQGYGGLNNASRSYLQIRPEFSFYQKITSNGSVVLSDRIGGGVTFGSPAFYQSLFLGGQGNLLGYLQYRFAGKHMVFNNLQGRIKLANIASYIIPGQLGLSGFYDAGRVWSDHDNSDKWHQGVGGGVYFSPAGLTVLQVLAGHSEEGWYPYISLNFRI